eukprot:GHVN01024055.1.p1 GENE.GHVN01024055.1~~GHVN01024055.1.p1  ORF type:complete len:754 (+),score=88.62 GHVN01024055.1:555-2816(+)
MGRDKMCQAIDVILRRAAAERCEPLKKSFFPLSATRENGGLIQLRSTPLALWMGHLQSAIISKIGGTPTSGGQVTWSLNMNASGTLAHEEQSLTEWLRKLRSAETVFSPQAKWPILRERWTERSRSDQVVNSVKEINKHLKGLKLMVQHSRDDSGNQFQRKNLKAFGLDPTVTAETHKFEHDGVEISVKDYFLNRYQVALRFPKLPLVQLVRKSTYFPIELCSVQRQVSTKEIADDVKAEIGGIMTMDPQARRKYIDEKRTKELGPGGSRNAILEKYGIEIAPEMMEITGKVIPPPKVAYGGNRTIEPARGAWNLARLQFVNPIRITNWAVVGLEDRVSKQDALSVAQEMRDAAALLGMQITAAPELNQVKDPQQMKEALERYRGEKKQLVVMLIVNPTFKKEAKYRAEANVPTQFLLYEKFKRANQQYWANVMAKVNQKVATSGQPGVNQVIAEGANNPLKSVLGNDGGSMIVAASFSRGPFRAGGLNRTPSMCALVGSMDPRATVYQHSARAQQRTETIIQDENMYAMFNDIMNYRKTVVQTAPKRLIYLRDGVSEGQYEEIFKEARQLVKWYADKGLQPPTLTVIITQRAHQTRIFPRGKDIEGNAPPGTVILDNLTHWSPYPNFYLLSHAGIIGTSHPCRYFVLKDDNRIERDVLIHSMFALCHIYGRCTRSVSVPAPCFYAKLLAERCLQHVNVRINEEMSYNLSDTQSISSGGGSTAEHIPTTENIIKEVNPWLENLSKRAFPHFYC